MTAVLAVRDQGGVTGGPCALLRKPVRVQDLIERVELLLKGDAPVGGT